MSQNYFKTQTTNLFIKDNNQIKSIECSEIKVVDDILSFQIFLNNSDMQLRLFYLYLDRHSKRFDIAVGFSDSKEEPGIVNDEIQLSENRTWIKSAGYVDSLDFIFQSNDVVECVVYVKLTQDIVYKPVSVNSDILM